MLFWIFFWGLLVIWIVSTTFLNKYHTLYIGELAAKRYCGVTKEEECNVYTKYSSRFKICSLVAQISGWSFIVMLVVSQFVSL